MGVTLPDGGRAEKLGILVLPFGGWGNEATLMGLRKVLPDGLDSLVIEPEMDLMVGMLEVEWACCGTKAEEDDVEPKGARSPNLEDPYDVEGSLAERRVSNWVGALFRNPCGGKGGRAAFGGLMDGRDGCGSVAAMVKMSHLRSEREYETCFYTTNIKTRRRTRLG